MEKSIRLKSKQQLQTELDAEDFSRITLSFYKYVQIKDVKKLRDDMHKQLHDLNCKGRIYLAPEGINAQMNVPEHQWEAFDSYIQSIPEFVGVPYKIAVQADSKSFIKLIVRVKERIVADGLDDPTFDASDTGSYLTARQMNKYVDDPDALVVDMRNEYESEIGHFEGAITPAVDTFKEELQAITQDLAEYKDKKIALYCTGGIRCEKASAWMKHNGFNNVSHLKGGIIDYAHQVKEQELPNKFKGKNFVFDERLGERISEEIIATCHLCHKTPADNHYHCNNLSCHVLYIGCNECVERKQGYCSVRCTLFDKLPDNLKKTLSKNRYKQDVTQYRKHRLKPSR